MAAYREAVAAAQPALNVAALIGHTTLRFLAVADLARTATPAENEHMAALLDECMAAGAQDMPSGLFAKKPMPHRQRK